MQGAARATLPAKPSVTDEPVTCAEQQLKQMTSRGAKLKPAKI